MPPGKSQKSDFRGLKTKNQHEADTAERRHRLCTDPFRIRWSLFLAHPITGA